MSEVVLRSSLSDLELFSRNKLFGGSSLKGRNCFLRSSLIDFELFSRSKLLLRVRMIDFEPFPAL